MADDPSADPPAGDAPTFALLLAAGRAPGLFELVEAEPTAALPFAGRRRVADLAVADALGAGVRSILVALPSRADPLARHLAARWGDRLDLAATDAGDPLGAALRAAEGGGGATRLLVLPADQVGPEGLGWLMAAPGAAARATVTGGGPGPAVLDLAWLRAARARGARDLSRDLAPDLAGLIAEAPPLAGPPRRRLDSLDAYREAQLDFLRARRALPGEGPLRESPGDGATLAFEVAGLALSAPRFGARRAGRWTLLDDSVVLPGARVAPGARLTRTLVAPGAVVPAGLVVGEDPAEDARWFRVAGATTLVTTAMLARRAAERMRAHAGVALAGRPAALAPTGHS